MTLWNKTLWTLLAAVLLLGLPGAATGQISVELEGGLAFSGYNDVQIPRETGTRISLSEELSTDSKFVYRIRISKQLGRRHVISALVAPLTLKAAGSVNRAVTFEGVTFLANTNLDATYRFDSYRLTYRYRIRPEGRFRWGLGLTAKIRDAAVRLAAGNVVSEKTNTGLVPLINFRLDFDLTNRLGLLVTGDALASPQGQGRAEDVLAALVYRMRDNIFIRAGYRILEGGADVEEVYNFTLVHYLVAGMRISL